MINIQSLYRRPVVQSVLAARRRHRARFLLSKVATKPGMSILDIGCGIDPNSLAAVLPPDYKIVGVDLHPAEQVKIWHANFTYVRQDAEDLSCFADNHFDLAVSVGMMEHICDQKKLLRIAGEMNRVARQSIIVVPWKYSWLEPHFKVPFFQLLPWSLQLRIVQTLSCNDLGSRANESADEFRQHFLDTYQWLRTSQWKSIFSAQHAYLTPTRESLIVVRTGGIQLVASRAQAVLGRRRLQQKHG